MNRVGLEAQEELASARSADELLAVVRRSAQEGVLEADTAQLLTRSLLFGHRRAHHAMTPRVRVQAVDADDPVSALVARAAMTGYSRFPVRGRDIDDVLGVVQVMDAIAVPAEARATTPVSAVMRPALFVPSSLPMDELLDVVQERGRLAVVVDEYGGTRGIVTLEDLVEELVGEVDDEFDPGAATTVARDGDAWLVPGVLRPDEAARALRHPVPTGSWTTVAGLFLAHFGSLPAVGDSVVVDDLRWTVRALQGRRIVQLAVQVDA